MYQFSEPSPPSDVCLLLRAHAEQRWLSTEVIPVLRQLEARDFIPDEQIGAALAYLEVIWLEARQRARETDAVHGELTDSDSPLSAKACRYYGTVRHLRETVGTHVLDALRPCESPSPNFAEL